MSRTRNPRNLEPALPHPSSSVDRQKARAERIQERLDSPDVSQRVAAVRALCPCQTNWVIPVKHLLFSLCDPHPQVQKAIAHVLEADSQWGRTLEDRRQKQPRGGRRPRTRGWRRDQLRPSTPLPYLPRAASASAIV